MQAKLQGVEVQSASRGDDDYPVEHAVRGQALEQRVVQLREVAVERPQVAALDVDVAGAAEHEGAEAVPFRLEQEIVSAGQHVGELGEHRLDGRRKHGALAMGSGSGSCPLDRQSTR